MLEINKKEVSVYFVRAYGQKLWLGFIFIFVELLGHFSLSVSISWL